MAASKTPKKSFPESVCRRCGKLVRFQWALRIDGRVFHTRCDDHTLRFFAGMTGQSPFVCQGCNKPVVDEVCRRIGDQYYHEQCLKCATCRQPFADLACYQVDDKHYCRQCHWAPRRDELLESDDPQVVGKDE